ncbi:MAG: hypothetical protein K2K98_12700 [Muribaculaceae bacterium]|nr:hypothetical protein [Muribaculaceae bacterium]
MLKIFNEEIQDRIDLSTVFSTEELEQLKRLAASAFAGLVDADVVEIVPPEE